MRNKENAIELTNVCVNFNLNKEKVDDFKDYIIKLVKGEIKYTEFKALENINLEVKKGDHLGVFGLNGAGKSTLMKIIAGVLKPSSGKSETSGRIVPLIELGAGFDPQYTGRENIFLYGSVLGYRRDFISAHYKEIVAFSELGDFIDVPLKNYSSGMKARLGFAIATVVKPQILILDEVLSVGDAKFKKKCMERMNGMMSSGTTVILVSHSPAQVRQLCNKAIILDHGHLIQYGDVEEVTQAYERMVE